MSVIEALESLKATIKYKFNSINRYKRPDMYGEKFTYTAPDGTVISSSRSVFVAVEDENATRQAEVAVHSWPVQAYVDLTSTKAVTFHIGRVGVSGHNFFSAPYSLVV